MEFLIFEWKKHNLLKVLCSEVIIFIFWIPKTARKCTWKFNLICMLTVDHFNTNLYNVCLGSLNQKYMYDEAGMDGAVERTLASLKCNLFWVKCGMKGSQVCCRLFCATLVKQFISQFMSVSCQTDVKIRWHYFMLTNMLMFC